MIRSSLMMTALVALVIGSGATAAIQTTTTPATTEQAAPTTTAPAAQAPAAAAPAGPTMVGGVAMAPTKTIVENASAAPNLSVLVKALTAAGLVPTLSGPGPFTVFAPDNDAIGRLAPGAIDTLMKPENKAALVKVLTYHVVKGSYTTAQLKQMVTQGGGSATLTTVEGEPLTVTVVNDHVALTGVNKNASYVTTPDVQQSNGVVHVVNGVLVPNLG